MESKGQMNFSSIEIGNLDIRDDIQEQDIASNVPVVHTQDDTEHNEIPKRQKSQCLVCGKVHLEGEACDSATHILTSCYDRWNIAISEISQLIIKLEQNYKQHEKLIIKLRNYGKLKQKKQLPPLDIEKM